MEKKYLFAFFILISILSAQGISAAGLVPCNGPDCKITSFFELISRVFNFVVKNIAAPLAALMITIGGVLILISAGNPNLVSLGKKILWAAVIGVFLVFCAWLIVNVILTTLGYRGTWNVL